MYWIEIEHYNNFSFIKLYFAEPVKGEIKGKAERTETDRKHERRVKKKKQKLKQIAREKRAKLTGNTIIQLKKAKDKLSKTSDSDKNTRKNQIKFK